LSHHHSGRETQHADQKSLRVITGNSADWSALAADCVCFAMEKSTGVDWQFAELLLKAQRLGQRSAGGTQPFISQKVLNDAVLPLPSVAEQAEAANSYRRAIEEVVNLESAIDAGLRQSTAQRQTLLRAAFAGQLVPQDPGDEPASVLVDRIRAERVAHGQTSKPRRRISKEAT
jgi:type I restriction enzyme, S subunit